MLLYDNFVLKVTQYVTKDVQSETWNMCFYKNSNILLERFDIVELDLLRNK